MSARRVGRHRTARRPGRAVGVSIVLAMVAAGATTSYVASIARGGAATRAERVFAPVGGTVGAPTAPAAAQTAGASSPAATQVPPPNTPSAAPRASAPPHVAGPPSARPSAALARAPEPSSAAPKPAPQRTPSSTPRSAASPAAVTGPRVTGLSCVSAGAGARLSGSALAGSAPVTVVMTVGGQSMTRAGSASSSLSFSMTAWPAPPGTPCSVTVVSSAGSDSRAASVG